MPTRQLQTVPQPPHPKGDALGNHPPTHKPRPPSSSFPRPSSPPAVVRGQIAPPLTFDFEESLSAANVTSVVNQFPSYSPPIRHHTSPAPPSQDAQMDIRHPSFPTSHHHHVSPQKPGSSSSLSSTGHHTDATRRTNASYDSSTSASSLPPATEVSLSFCRCIWNPSPGSLRPASLVRTVELGDYPPDPLRTPDSGVLQQPSVDVYSPALVCLSLLTILHIR